MIIKNIQITNFGAYLGTHEIDLTPQLGKPVILIGALNGSGKTTLLDALKLSLHGKFADCSTRGSSAYPDFLKSCINRHSTDGSASISISLNVSNDLDLKVMRSWSSTGANAKEEVRVWVNDIESPETAERWYEYVGNIAPYEISSLFFYDGEMIEEISSKQSSSEIIKKGLHSLLGLDLVTSLTNDLEIIGRKKKSELLEDEEILGHKELDSKIEDLEKLLMDLSHEEQRLRDEIVSEETQLKNRQQTYEINGGNLVSQKIILEKNLKKVQTDIEKTIDERIVEESGVLPLALVSSLITQCIEAAKSESNAASRALIRSSMDILKNDLLKRSKSGLPDAYDALKELLEESIQSLAPDTSTEAYLSAHDVDISEISGFKIERIEEAKSRSSIVNSRLEQLKNDELTIKSALNAIPDPESVAYIAQEIDTRKGEIAKLKFMLETLNSAQSNKSKDLVELKTQRDTTLNRAISEKFSNQKEKAAIDQIESFTKILSRFKTESSTNHLSRIGSLVKESLETIMRKSDFVKTVKLSPETYEISLFDDKNIEIQPSRLSAGERQLLATSILWSLSKAAKHEMPTVIDTPLGRLDGKHRSKLVKNYFSNAGNQVILLSTDEEITGKYLKILEPSIARKYIISYEDQQKSSSVSIGYFEEANAA